MAAVRQLLVSKRRLLMKDDGESGQHVVIRRLSAGRSEDDDRVSASCRIVITIGRLLRSSHIWLI